MTKLILNKHFPLVIFEELGSCLWYLNTGHLPVFKENLKKQIEKELSSVGVASLLKQSSKRRDLPGATQ